MPDDPKKVLVEIVGRLSRETQFHLDERHRHFQVTNLVLITMSLLLFVFAAVNVYYIYLLSEDLDGIVVNMDSMHTNLKQVDGHMVSLTDKVELMDQHLTHMDQITANAGAMADNMVLVRGSMDSITGEVAVINNDMRLINHSMLVIDQRIGHMTGGVSIIRQNMRQMSGPMGFMNPMLP
jgi:hypothetical protein